MALPPASGQGLNNGRHSDPTEFLESRGAAAKNRCAIGRAIFIHSGGFIGEFEPTFLLEFVVAALVNGAFEELLLLARGDFFD